MTEDIWDDDVRWRRVPREDITANAGYLRQRMEENWDAGQKEYGKTFVGDPVSQAFDELADIGNYFAVIVRFLDEQEEQIEELQKEVERRGDMIEELGGSVDGRMRCQVCSNENDVQLVSIDYNPPDTRDIEEHPIAYLCKPCRNTLAYRMEVGKVNDYDWGGQQEDDEDDWEDGDG